MKMSKNSFDDIKKKIIGILLNDYYNKKSKNLPLSAFALFQINEEKVKSELIKNFTDFDIKSRLKLAKLIQIDKDINPYVVLKIIENEKSSQVKSNLYTYYQHYKIDEIILPQLISHYWTEKSPKVKDSILRAIRVKSREKGEDLYIKALENENHKEVLYTIFQTLRSYKNDRILNCCINWLRKNGKNYDFNSIHHALMILMESDYKYLNKNTFNALLHKSEIKLHTTWNEDLYDVCRKSFNQDYQNVIGFVNPFSTIIVFPQDYINQIESMIESGVFTNILNDELHNQIDIDYFNDLVKFCIDLLSTNNISNICEIITKNPNIYSKFENNIEFNPLREFSKLLDYHKLESICKKCKTKFVHYWPHIPIYSDVVKLEISKDYCVKHRFFELEQIIKELIQDVYIKKNYPISRKIEIYNKTKRDRSDTLFIQSVWLNEIAECKCGEKNFPLSIENKCPLCHLQKNSNVNENIINILNSINEIDAVHYDYFEQKLVDYYGIIEYFKQNRFKINDKEYLLESYLITEEELILSWFIAKKIYDKVIRYDSVQWVNEKKTVDLVLEVLKTNNIIRYMSWAWLKSPVSGFNMNVDAFFPEFNLALEYQGLQHFQPIDYFGGESSFKNQCFRDSKKKELLKQHNITLLEVNKDELKKDILIKKLKSLRILA